MGAPRILVSTWRRQGYSLGPILRDMVGAEAQYISFVQRGGGAVYLATQPAEVTAAAAADAVAGFDGLVLIGGEDLAPETSGISVEEPGANASAERDSWESGLLAAALSADLPVLAVCRGLQLLNCHLGGSLHAEIGGRYADHPVVPAPLEEALAYRHPVRLDPGSRLAGIVGTESLSVNSLHHQAIDRLADGLTVTGRSEDGLVEAVELDSAYWCLGVQWHPELLPPDDPRQGALGDAFVEACRSRRASAYPN